jgi:hypothetical protein
MADEYGYEKERTDALKRIALALDGINQKLEKVVQKRVHLGTSGQKEYWVLVTEPHDVGVK